MQGHDLKASFVIAAVWLIGITMYSIWGVPLDANDEAGYLGAGAGSARGEQVLAAADAPKHWKLPALWMHQRWGAD